MNQWAERRKVWMRAIPKAGQNFKDLSPSTRSVRSPCTIFDLPPEGPCIAGRERMNMMSLMRTDALGLYISIPFCRSKCTYCNFASGVYPAREHARYVDRLMQ